MASTKMTSILVSLSVRPRSTCWFRWAKRPELLGSGCFFLRRALFGGPSTPVLPESRNSTRTMWYRLQCEGWKGLFCNPERAAFLGDAPITLIDVLVQCKRWHWLLSSKLLQKQPTNLWSSIYWCLNEPRYRNRGSSFIFLVLGAYGQDFLDFVLAGGTSTRLGISTHEFSLTSKVHDDAQSKDMSNAFSSLGYITVVCATDNGSNNQLVFVHVGLTGF
ncbi:hypothetical protein F3Y22_tig00013960pilonHSYRG00132 [Hibiscus syriacus]|uniref:Uncharacterized protein n=1 Tax=Hibiscus syriacus TaxID=106335 RepID=A0A6A3C0J4_HIBSY|nr:hypothetical protein F3Y22_tig00013960pilonHSYRG00132 [Hibiscus syriacus]